MNESTHLLNKYQVQPFAGDCADEAFMREALSLARQASAKGEVPIGAVLVQEGQVLGKGFNQPIAQSDTTAHAEVQAIRQACQAAGNYRLPHSTLYVTLQPCLMCMGALMHARVSRVVVGSSDTRFCTPVEQLIPFFEASPAWSACRFDLGCLQEDSQNLLVSFFESKRNDRTESIRLIRELIDLPNINKHAVGLLKGLGYQVGADLLEPDLQTTQDRIQQLCRTLNRLEYADEIAMLKSLCDYLGGSPVRSWKTYL